MDIVTPLIFPLSQLSERAMITVGKNAILG